MATTLRNHFFLVALICGLMFDSMLLWANGTPETWIDQITLQVLTQQKNAKRDGLEQTYSRYLEQLQNVRAVLAHGNHQAVQDEMNRLIEMLGTKEGANSDSSAITLLYSVGRVTPIQYLDDRALNHLRLIMDRFDDTANDAEADMQSGWNILAAKQAGWCLRSIGSGTFTPIVTLGIGVWLQWVPQSCCL
jgi:hypothetical protein